MVCFCSIVLLLTFVKFLIYFCYFFSFTLHFIVYVLSAFVFPFFWFFKIFLLFCVFVLYFFFQFGFFFWIFASFLFNCIILFSGSLSGCSLVLCFYFCIISLCFFIFFFFFFLLLLLPFVLVYSSIHLFLFFFGHPVWFQGLFFFPARGQARASVVGVMNSGHWTTRKFLAPGNINWWEFSMRSPSWLQNLAPHNCF